MSDIPSTEYIQIVRELSALGVKIDNFFAVQNSMKAEIDGLKTDISSVKADVAEIKTLRKTTKGYLAGVVAAVTAVWWILGQFAQPLAKKFLGI